MCRAINISPCPSHLPRRGSSPQAALFGVIMATSERLLQAATMACDFGFAALEGGDMKKAACCAEPVLAAFAGKRHWLGARDIPEICRTVMQALPDALTNHIFSAVELAFRDAICPATATEFVGVMGSGKSAALAVVACVMAMCDMRVMYVTPTRAQQYWIHKLLAHVSASARDRVHIELAQNAAAAYWVGSVKHNVCLSAVRGCVMASMDVLILDGLAASDVDVFGTIQQQQAGTIIKRVHRHRAPWQSTPTIIWSACLPVHDVLRMAATEIRLSDFHDMSRVHLVDPRFLDMSDLQQIDHWVIVTASANDAKHAMDQLSTTYPMYFSDGSWHGASKQARCVLQKCVRVRSAPERQAAVRLNMNAVLMRPITDSATGHVVELGTLLRVTDITESEETGDLSYTCNVLTATPHHLVHISAPRECSDSVRGAWRFDHPFLSAVVPLVELRGLYFAQGTTILLYATKSAPLLEAWGAIQRRAGSDVHAVTFHQDSAST